MRKPNKCDTCDGTKRKQLIKEIKEFIMFVTCWHHKQTVEDGWGYRVWYCHKCNLTCTSFLP
jgi:hypothetical protein